MPVRSACFGEREPALLASCKEELAEREGFEPSMELPP
jgi:hypothetical protein